MYEGSLTSTPSGGCYTSFVINPKRSWGDAVVANAKKHLPTLLQQKKSTALSQLRANSKHWNQVATYLQEQAHKLTQLPFGNSLSLLVMFTEVHWT